MEESAQQQLTKDSGTEAAKATHPTTYVIPCTSCNAFLSLTTHTAHDQICQACKTPVTPLMQLIHSGHIDELPLPPASNGTLVVSQPGLALEVSIACTEPIAFFLDCAMSWQRLWPRRQISKKLCYLLPSVLEARSKRTPPRASSRLLRAVHWYMGENHFREC